MCDRLFEHRSDGDQFSLLTLRGNYPTIGRGGYQDFMRRYQRLRRLRVFDQFSHGIGCIEVKPTVGHRQNIHCHLVTFSLEQIDHETVGNALRDRWSIDPEDSVDLRRMRTSNVDLKKVSNYMFKNPWTGKVDGTPEWETFDDEQLLDVIDGLRGKRLLLRF